MPESIMNDRLSVVHVVNDKNIFKFISSIDSKTLSSYFRSIAMKKKQRRENGKAIVRLAFALIGLVGSAALAIAGGLLYSDRRHAQNAADAGSLAVGGQVADLLLDSQNRLG